MREVRHERRCWEWYYLDRLFNTSPNLKDIRESRALGRHGASVRDVAYSKQAGGLVSVDSDGEVLLWDASVGGSPRPLARLGPSLEEFTFSADGSLIAAVAPDSSRPGPGVAEVLVWQVATGREVFRSAAIPASVTSVAFSADGSRLAAALGGGAEGPGGLRAWEVATKEELFAIAEEEAVLGIAFSPDGRRIAGGLAGSKEYTTLYARMDPGSRGAKNVVKLWDLENGGDPRELWIDSIPAVLIFAPDGLQLLAGEGPRIWMWDVKTGYMIMVLAEQTGDVRDLAFNPDGSRLVSVADDGTLKIWEYDHHKRTTPVGWVSVPGYWSEERRVPGDPWGSMRNQALLSLGGAYADAAGPTAAVAFSPDGQMVITGGDDGAIRLLDGRPHLELITSQRFSHLRARCPALTRMTRCQLPTNPRSRRSTRGAR